MVAGINRLELRFLHAEIVGRGVYWRHGIAVRDGDVVVDAGANIGLFAMEVARRAAGARILAFEPMPRVFAALATNRTAHFPDALVFDHALGAAEGMLAFTFYPRCTGWSTAHPDVAGLRGDVAALLPWLPRGVTNRLVDWLAKAETVIRPVATLSTALRRTGIDRVDLLKIDAERAELDILRGIADGDWPRVRQVVLEAQAADLAGIAGLLRARGFTVVAGQDDALAATGYHLLYATR